MVVARVYETKIADDETGLTARIVVVPAKSMGDTAYAEDPERLLASIGLEASRGVTAVNLIPTLAQLLLSSELVAEGQEGVAGPRGFRDRDLEPRHWNFAAYLAFQPIVPFEESPLKGVSLGALLSASPAAAGAGMGVVIAGGSVPLLFVLTPAGALMAHFGAAFARGAARPLEQAGEDLTAAILERLVPSFRYRPPSGPSETGEGREKGSDR
ncbi:MAG: hypothetical protein M3Q49_02390 [Actinomycetota bacterium]|nr:hypothetical protein [Actinomycetota bacterium]PLS84335.1 MAG: hypothetical protein CYG60_18530 [Actinomycetota bacterium]